MISKKAQSDTGIIVFIVAFQVFLVLALGFLNVDVEEEEIGSQTFGFTQNIITNISLLGVWNLLLFSPLIVGFTYIIARLIRGGG